jgi:glutamyl-tRNA reductase
VTIVLVGLNHETAPVEVRECFYLSDSDLKRALEKLWYDNQYSALSESIIISTCNRLEIYGVADSAVTGFETMTHFLAQLHEVPREQLFTSLYFMEGRDAIEHVMQVAGGLNSLILGETQILGQVSHALAMAQAAETSGAHLSHLFNHAIHAGKRARTETEISQHTTSVSHAAARLAEQELGNLENTRTLVVGAGEMAELAAKALQMHGAQSIQIISRTFNNAVALANQLDVQAREWSHLPAALNEAELIISATGAPHSVIHVADVEVALANRANPSLFIIDIAVPRDVDEAVRHLPDVKLYDIDDLQLVVDHNKGQRQAAIEQVEDIIAEELEHFLEWLHSREVVPVIVDLRRKAKAIAEAELEQAFRRMGDISDHDREVMNKMVHRIVNKLLHNPTTALRSHAGTGGSLQYAAIVRELFDLDAEEAAAQDKIEVEVEESRHG